MSAAYSLVGTDVAGSWAWSGCTPNLHMTVAVPYGSPYTLALPDAAASRRVLFIRLLELSGGATAGAMVYIGQEVHTFLAEDDYMMVCGGPFPNWTLTAKTAGVAMFEVVSLN